MPVVVTRLVFTAGVACKMTCLLHWRLELALLGQDEQVLEALKGGGGGGVLREVTGRGGERRGGMPCRQIRWHSDKNQPGKTHMLLNSLLFQVKKQLRLMLKSILALLRIRSLVSSLFIKSMHLLVLLHADSSESEKRNNLALIESQLFDDQVQNETTV